MTTTDRQLAKIICDSVSPDGVRLTTMEVVFPRIVLAEFNTHRVFSRNSASSRAIPVEKMLKKVEEDPYIPEVWTKNGKGMQGHGVLTNEYEIAEARSVWLAAREHATQHARHLLDLGIHKQTTNRLLEPWMWHTCIVTATEWSNFFHLRDHPAAHPAIQRTAAAMHWEYESKLPRHREWGDWHLPYIQLEDDEAVVRLEEDTAMVYPKISSARCARVSYLTHDGRHDPQADLGLHGRLLEPGHMSPFEHAARCDQHFPAMRHEKTGERFIGNFRAPWAQYRKMIPYEWDVHSDPARQAS